MKTKKKTEKSILCSPEMYENQEVLDDLLYSLKNSGRYSDILLLRAVWVISEGTFLFWLKTL